jgi:Flp pilus assembly protein TadG
MSMAHRIVVTLRAGLSTGDRGSASVFVVGMIVVLFALAGLVADGGRALNARVEIMDNAEQAARSGANQIDDASLRGTGAARIDPVAARDKAITFLSARGYDPARMTVTADANTVSVEVSDTVPTSLLQLAFIDSFDVRGSATARAALGINDEIGAP